VTKKAFRVHGVSNQLWNDDIAPIPHEEQTWGPVQFCLVWMALAVCIPTYMLASGLIVLGMSWKQALGTILLGNVIVLVPILLNSHAGTKYGIPFLVYARASFGVRGAQVPAVLHGLVTCGWFGIQCWIGGLALFAILKLVVPSIAGNAVWYCFTAFWLLTMVVVLRGMETVRAIRLPVLLMMLVLIVGLALLLWMVSRVGGVSAILASAAEFRPAAGLRPAATLQSALGWRPAALSGEGPPNFWVIFMPSLTGVIGFWATVALNIPDLSRFARSQRAQVLGQAWGLPGAMTVYSLLAIAITAVTVRLTPGHRAIWNPIEIIAGFPQPFVAVLGLAIVAVATLVYNVKLNVAGPSQAFSNLRPNLISLRTGGLIAGLLGVCCAPWLLIADPERYIFGWLIGYSGLLGPVAGVMIVDYFIVRRRALDVESLYVRGGQYEYTSGFNKKAMTAWSVGAIVALVGLFVSQLHALYAAAWLAGFGTAALAYLVLMSGPPEIAAIPPTPLLIPIGEFEGEGA